MENQFLQPDNESKLDTHSLRSVAEAHLFAAVTKGDGTVTTKELSRVGYLAQRAQKRFDFLGSNDRIPESVRKNIQILLTDSQYRSWNREQHVKAAMELLQQASESGDWAVKLTADKIEPALLEVALLDGYDLNESQFVKCIVNRLRELNSDQK